MWTGTGKDTTAMGPLQTLLTVDGMHAYPPNTLIYSAILYPHWPGLLISWSLHLLFFCPLHHTWSLSSRLLPVTPLFMSTCVYVIYLSVPKK